ncbi:MAG: phosphoglycerate kinase [Deltaproteobacteria bacterium]|nr:phosphoglycerate kinase [Deltaproteobacteria bacterium]
MKFIDEINIDGGKVLFRFDFNVPLDNALQVTDDTRITEALPTIRYALNKKARVIMMSHLGRPKGKKSLQYSLAPVAGRLSTLLGRDVKMAGDCIGRAVEELVDRMEPDSLILLENLRFHAEEEANDDEFASSLAALADVYIDDAFGNAHRAHASNTGVTKFVKACGAGFLIKKELNYLKTVLEKPDRPFVAIIGGAKVSGKMEVLLHLMTKVDKMIIGGAMAFTFLKAQGYDVGKSLVEDDLQPKALEIMDMAEKQGVKLLLPVDCVMAEDKTNESPNAVMTIQSMNPEWMGLDIGPETTALFSKALKDAKTIVWNGPMGLFEMDAYSAGTSALARSVAASSAVSVVGGGDTVTAVHKAGVAERMSFISTGGGASLELLEGRVLPAIEALEHCGSKI